MTTLIGASRILCVVGTVALAAASAHAQDVPNWATCYLHIVEPGVLITSSQKIKNPQGVQIGNPATRFSSATNELEAVHAVYLDQWSRPGTYSCDITEAKYLNSPDPIYVNSYTRTVNVQNSGCDCAPPLATNSGFPNNVRMPNAVIRFDLEPGTPWGYPRAQASQDAAQFWNDRFQNAGANARFEYSVSGGNVIVSLDAGLPPGTASAACSNGSGTVRLRPEIVNNATTKPSQAYDILRGVLTHEFGHCIAWGHAAQPCQAYSIMYEVYSPVSLIGLYPGDTCAAHSDYGDYQTGTGSGIPIEQRMPAGTAPTKTSTFSLPPR